MKKATLYLVALFFVSAVFANSDLGTVSHKVSASSSKVNWKAHKVTGSHEGFLGVKSAELVYTDGSLTGGSFVLDATSITVTDLSGKYKGDLEGHLKSPDFFAVGEYPEAKFVITKVVSRGAKGEYKVVGNLTIKGITKEIKFNTTVVEKAGAPVSASAEFEVDRTDFNVKYGSGSFFDDLGDKTIYDEFELKISLVVN